MHLRSMFSVWPPVLQLVLLLMHSPMVLTQDVNIEIKPMEESQSHMFTHEFESSFSILDHIQTQLLKNKIQTFCQETMLSADDVIECSDKILSHSLTIYYEQGGHVKQIPSYLDPERVVSSFRKELVEEACSGYLGEVMSDCHQAAADAIQSIKILHMGSKMEELKSHIDTNDLIPVAPNWRNDTEGSTIRFHGKLELFQSLADDERVETICEVGFNVGHSTASWLSANPRASVLAFDVSRYMYTAAAINAMGEVFPGRVVTLIEGDSKQSVPNFIELLRHSSRNQIEDPLSIQCNLIFIDGAHDLEGALTDIFNLMPLANATYHRIIIDDMHVPEVKEATDTAINHNWMRVHELREVNRTLCNYADPVMMGPFTGSYVFREKPAHWGCDPTWLKIPAKDTVLVAEYVL